MHQDKLSIGWTPHLAVSAGCYALFFAIACIPIFAFEVLPLGDMPNHLARAYILEQIADDPLLQKFYTVRWRLFSFQSTDILLPLLIRNFGLSLGHQLFVAGAFALLIGGTAAIHRALFGRIGLWPAAAFLLLFNFPLVAGQVSFLFSTGLSLVLFAAWISSEHKVRSLRLPIFAAATFGLMLCHFFAFAAYALLVMSFEFGRAWRMPTLGMKVRRLGEAGLPFVVPAVCFLSFFGQTIYGATSYGDAREKLIAAFAGTLTYGRWPDFVLTIGIIAGLWWLSRRQRIAFAPDMRLPVFVLGIAAIAMPRLLQGVFGADLRLPCLLVFLLVAASEVRLERRQVVALWAGIFALLMLRVATTTLQWRHFDADYREFRAADQALVRGSRVAMIPPGDDLRAAPQPLTAYWFTGCLAVIDRQVFTPVIYTAATPLALTEEGKKLNSDTLVHGRTVRWHPAGSAFAGVNPETVRQVDKVGQRISDQDVFTSTIDWSDWPERFDYLIDFHIGRLGNPVPALLTEVVRGSYFTIYRIHPPQQP